MKINVKTVQIWLIAIMFAAFWGWIEYNMVAPPYGKLIFIMTYAIIIAAFFNKQRILAAVGSLAAGYMVEELCYRYFADLAFWNRYYMLALGIALGVVFVLSIVDLRKINRREEAVKLKEVVEEKPPLEEKTKIEPPKEEIKIEIPATIYPIETTIGEEEKFDPEKETLRQKLKEKYLKKEAKE